MCAWTFTPIGETETSGFPEGKFKREDEWLLATETITLDSSATDQSTSVIDFLPFGKDWIVEVDPSATLATNATVDIDYALTRSGTFTELATTGASALKAGTASRNLIDNSAKNTSTTPYLKLRLDKAGALDAAAAKTVAVNIIMPPKDGIVY